MRVHYCDNRKLQSMLPVFTFLFNSHIWNATFMTVLRTMGMRDLIATRFSRKVLQAVKFNDLFNILVTNFPGQKKECQKLRNALVPIKVVCVWATHSAYEFINYQINRQWNSKKKKDIKTKTLSPKIVTYRQTSYPAIVEALSILFYDFYDLRFAEFGWARAQEESVWF